MFSSLPSAVCVVLSGPVDRAFVSCYSTNDAFTTRDLHEQVSFARIISQSVEHALFLGVQIQCAAGRPVNWKHAVISIGVATSI